MKADESKDLIERVGGLEAAQVIVDRASGTQARYWRVTNGRFYSTHEGRGVFCYGLEWHKTHYLQSSMDCSPDFIKLSDLRTAITEQRPHPCATCPNHGHKACCHEVA